MVKYHINFFITNGFLLPQFFGLAVRLLQLLQREPHITNDGFMRSLIGELGLEATPKMPERWQSIYSADWDLMLKREAWNRSVDL